MIDFNDEMINRELDREWVRSSRCTPGSNCVEVQLRADMVGVRDSKHVGMGRLAFSPRQWTEFLLLVSS